MLWERKEAGLIPSREQGQGGSGFLYCLLFKLLLLRAWTFRGDRLTWVASL